MYEEADIHDRILYPSDMTVTLLIHNDIELKEALVLGPEFGCTKFMSAPATTQVEITYSRYSAVYQLLCSTVLYCTVEY